MTNVIFQRGLSRTDASVYVGVGATKFDQLVADGRMPQPREIDRRLVWDRRELDLAFDLLPVRGASAVVATKSVWDAVAA